MGCCRPRGLSFRLAGNAATWVSEACLGGFQIVQILLCGDIFQQRSDFCVHGRRRSFVLQFMQDFAQGIFVVSNAAQGMQQRVETVRQ